MADAREIIRFIGRNGKRVAISVAGGALVVLGLVLLPLPGPGILVIIAGLAILATEYVWARRVLDETKRQAKRAREKARLWRWRRPSEGPGSKSSQNGT